MKKIIAICCFAAFTAGAIALPFGAATQGVEISNLGDKDKEKKGKNKKSKECCSKGEAKSCHGEGASTEAKSEKPAAKSCCSKDGAKADAPKK
jgi:hypothetical protein